MTQEGYKRKLTAILSADVEGYSRLMGEDEDATIKTLTTYRELMTTLITKHRGRVVDSPGDNLLAEFLSVVDAVRCAVEIQEELRIRNAELPETRRMHFRIGINLGDVVEEGERIYGDGINIAARVEGLAEGGGICISGTVYDSIKNKLSLSYESLGEHTVKNITEPVRVYRMRVGPEATAPVEREAKPHPKPWRKAALAALIVLIVAAGAFTIWNFYFRPPPIEPASEAKMAYPLPDKPSIAVLAFDNLSGDPSQEYFSDGIAEEIITALSRMGELFVVSRNSSFSYKGKPVKIQQISEELGVRYVLEGSVRRSGDKVRITAQLIDAIKGQHLWSEKYDRDFKDILDIQDDITMKIVNGLEITLTEGEGARMALKRYKNVNLDVYLKRIKTGSLFNEGSKESIIRVGQLAQEIIDAAPEHPCGYRWRGWYHHRLATRGISPRENYKKAFTYAQKALSLDESDPYSHGLVGYVYLIMRKYEKAIAHGRRSVELEPNGSLVHLILGSTLSYAGHVDEAIVHLKQALRLDPFPAFYNYLHLARCYIQKGQYEDALAEFKKALQCTPDFGVYLGLAITYALLDREEEARAAVKKVLEFNPKFSVANYSKILRFKNQLDKKKIIDAMRKAGLPEYPPLPLPDKPSIAVLPFTNMSEDPKQEYFSDGMTEEIITALSKTPKLFVIARTSSFKYKGKEVDVRTVGRELGVRYVLEGSVRKSKDQLRITAQLVDAQTGNHLWAERYDREMKDIFAVQDEITFKVIAALQVKLTEGEQALITAWGTDNFEAYAKFLRGIEYVRRFNAESNLLARKMAEEVIALDPAYPQGYRLLGTTHMMDVWFGSTKSPRKSLAEAVQLFQKVIAMYPSASLTRGLLGIVYTMMRQHEKGIAESEKAIALNPNVADNHAWFGFVLHLNGRHKEALVEIKKAIRLNPFPKSVYFMYLGHAYMYERMYDESIAAYKKALHVQPNNLFPHLRLAAVYSLLDRDEEARSEASEVLRINPNLSLKRFAKTIPFKSQSDTDHLIDALRKAGLK